MQEKVAEHRRFFSDIYETTEKRKYIVEVFFVSLSGGLSLAVEGPSKAEITCKDNKDGTCTVSYLPTAPGDYNIIVKFDNKHIPGSPFTAKITGKEVHYSMYTLYTHRYIY